MEAAARRNSRANVDAVPNNLPRYLTSFVGRGTDLAALKSKLAHSRMVTLTGPGGGGKSRLAAELCRASLSLWPDGVWWVELAPVSDPGQVPGAVVSALELPGRGRAQDVVVAWLAGKRALVVLDNCEHLLVACSDFCRPTLEHCAELTILATSREALGVPGEAHWPVSSLRATDALHLFEARAALVRPAFKVAATNLDQVTEICERLDRLPLAIELVAARMSMMTEQEILSQLSDRFGLLTGGSRTGPERLQTMRAAIDWSYRLLTEDEAMLFRRLSVFRGGFTLESAEAVCGDGMNASALDLIGGLVHKSMVLAEQTQDSGTRYRLLESQLAYAADRLREAGESELIDQGHYEYFRDCLSTKTISHAGPRALTGPRPGFPEAQWIARESGNLWAAIGWARNNADDLGLGLAADLAGNRLGDLAQMRSLLEELLHRSALMDMARVCALREASAIAYWQGDYDAAIGLARTGVALARERGDIEEAAQILVWAGQSHMGRGELATAAEMYEDATSLLKDSSNDRLMGFIKSAIAAVAVQRGDCAEALKILADCLITARKEGDVSRTAYLLDPLAWAQLGMSDPNAATNSWREALSTQRGLKNQCGMINCIEGLSCVAEARGDDPRAVRLAAAATRISSEISYKDLPFMLNQVDYSLGRSRARMGPRESEKTWKEGWSMSLDRAADFALAESGPESVAAAAPLSKREQEVARLVAAGLTNRQIGERLFISWRTVEGHIERIRNKLGVRSRTEVATWAVERGLMTDHLAVERGTSKKTGSRSGPPSPRR